MTPIQQSISPTASRALKALARQARDLTGADIERLVREARHKARRENRPLCYADIESLLVEARPVRSTMLRMRMATHEAGHAIARMVLDFGPIEEITIEAPKGGFVTGRIGQDEMTEEHLTVVLIQTLAGRAAEEVMLEKISANSGGADRSDLALATAIALDMETILGMGGKWPLLYRKPVDATSTLAGDPELAARVHDRLERAYQVARVIVREQAEAVDFLAERLFEAGTLEGSELDAVLAETRKRIRERPS